MARSSSATVESTPSGGGKGLALAALVLGFVGVGLSATALMKKAPESGGAGGGAGATTGTSSPDIGSGDALDRRLAQHASTLRTEVLSDFRREVQEAKEVLARAERGFGDAKASLEKLVADDRRALETAKVATAEHTEAVESRMREVADAGKKVESAVEALAATVKAIESRPVAAAPAAAVAPPAKKEEPKEEPVAGAPPTLSPEEIAANKERLKALVAEVESGDLDRIYSGVIKLGKLGDLEAVPVIVKVLREHKDYIVRQSAADALAALHACDAVPVLIELMSDKSKDVALACGVAFRKITDFDVGFDGNPSLKEKKEAQARATKHWTEHETAIRAKWNQPKAGAAAPPPAPAGEPPAGDEPK